MAENNMKLEKAQMMTQIVVALLHSRPYSEWVEEARLADLEVHEYLAAGAELQLEAIFNAT